MMNGDMKPIQFILNIPCSFIGLLLALISIPRRVRFIQDAVVFDVRSLWWTRLYAKGVRGTTNGNVVLLGPNAEQLDLKHELVHVRQFMKRPFIHEFQYFAEQLKNGTSPKNKYEEEAYRLAGNEYKGK
jgi:hypothetical protein